jgi:hypothetical protein
MEQAALAKAAGVSKNTISNMESRGAEKLVSGFKTVSAVQAALEDAGIEFLNHGRPGVRLRAIEAAGHEHG